MKAWKNVLVVMLVVILAFGMTSCSKDDDDNGTGPSTPTMQENMAGTWVSAGANVAPLLIGLYQTDTVRVSFTETTVTTREHRADSTGGAWQADQVGSWSLGETSENDIYSITIDYTEAVAFQQVGIVKIFEGTPDTLKLEVVIPSLATPPVPSDGFGTTVNGTNVQTFIRE